MNQRSTLPDPAKCKMRRVYDDLYECLVADHGDCPYANSFGTGSFCRMPTGLEFSVREKKEDHG